MRHREVYLAVALSFVLLVSSRAVSQDTNGSKHARETPIHRGILEPRKEIGPAAHKDRRALEEDTSIAGFKEHKEGLSEFKEAQQFMQLKAAVYADLSRLEKSRQAEPRCDAVRGMDSIAGDPETWLLTAQTTDRPENHLRKLGAQFCRCP